MHIKNEKVKHSTHGDPYLVGDVGVGGNVVAVLGNGVDVVVVLVQVVVVEVVVDIRHNIENHEGEGQKIERIDAVVAFAVIACRTTD